MQQFNIIDYIQIVDLSILNYIDYLELIETNYVLNNERTINTQFVCKK
jgi:hypothetical protein